MSIKNFKLYLGYPSIQTKKEGLTLHLNKTLFSSFPEGESYTFNEKLTEKEYGQCTFSFNSFLYINKKRNPFIKSLVIDRYLILEMEDSRIDFIITSISPSYSSDNVSYTFTCQDAFSFELSRISSTISLSTDDQDISGDWADGPKKIWELTSKILEESHTYWTNSDLVTQQGYRFYTDAYDINSDEKVISYEEESVSAYQALTDVLKQFDAYLEIDYDERTISYWGKDKIKFNGLYLRPETNVSNFSHSLKGDNLCNVFKVYGSEDGEGNYVSLVPTIPSVLQDFLPQIAEPSKAAYDDSSPANMQCVDGEYEYKDGSGHSKKTGIQWSDVWDCSKNNIYSNSAAANTFESRIRTLWQYVNNRMQDDDEWTEYFQYLSLVPSGTSILYDFDYWKENNLISQQTYEDIEKAWVDFRRLNILNACYYPKYLSYKYKLEQLEDQEDELYASIAAEQQSLATLATTVSSTISNRGLYYTSCIINVELVNGNFECIKYLPIGSIQEPGDVGNVLVWGKDSSNNNFNIPDFIYLSEYIRKWTDEKGNKAQVFYKKSSTIFKQIEDFEITSTEDGYSQFTTSVSNLAGTLYIKYDDYLVEFLEEKIPDFVEQKTDMIESSINSLENQLNNLHNEEYFVLKNAIRGFGWLSEELDALETKIKEKKELQNEIVSKIRTLIGLSTESEDYDNWRSYESTDENTAIFSEYADLVQQYDDLSYCVGGMGTREDDNGNLMLYSGWYNEKYSHLKQLEKSDLLSSDRYVDIVNKAIETQDQITAWWNKWYVNYGYLTRETVFEDSEQKTFKSLYSTASTQFESYKTPQTSYSLSYIKSDWLEDYLVPIRVGSRVRLSHPYVKESLKENQIKITFYSEIKTRPTIIILKTTTDAEVVADKFFILDNKSIILQSIYLDSYWNSEYSIESLSIDGVEYDGKRDVESIEPVYEGQYVPLVITGITTDLRSDIYQLSVEEYSIYKILVDRLLNLIK